MILRLARLTPLMLMLVVLASCGDQSFFMSSKTSAEEVQITSVADGTVVQSGGALPVTVTAPSASGTDYEIDITIVSASGETVWHNRSAVQANEQSPITLPSTLALGQYRVDYVAYSSGESVQKRSVAIFVGDPGLRISGIKSFPLVITSTATVMLKAELDVPAGANPYLRWSWKGKTIAKGRLADGLDTILWVTPADSGVYTVTLELFPLPPAAEADFPFTSPVALSTDIVVSDAAAATTDLGPASSYQSLLRLQATLDDTGTVARRIGKARAVAIGKPIVIAQDDCFGYKLDGSTGIQIPWFALPVEGGTLRPFTMSVRVSLADPGSAANLVRASTADGSVQILLAMDARAGGPSATFTVQGSPALVAPWPGPALAAGQRSLVSLSVVPAAASLSVQWFLDGDQVGAQTLACALPVLSQAGSVTIGGEKGFTGVVDEFGVYAQDSAGKPATDPDLYLRAQKKLLGGRLVLADGFDGIALSRAYAVQGRSQLAAGALSLSPGCGLTLPPVKTEGAPFTLTADLAADSARTATLSVAWEGEEKTAQSLTMAADKQGLRLGLAADGLTLTVLTAKGETSITLPAPQADQAHLLITIQAQPDSAAPLVLTRLLLARDQG
jgi:hypothetical protein